MISKSKAKNITNFFGVVFKKDTAGVAGLSVDDLRYNLIKEELEELKVSIKSKDLLEVDDILTDILYNTYGTRHALV